jgi:uncharacterized membrane protein (UPF0182 family)
MAATLDEAIAALVGAEVARPATAAGTPSATPGAWAPRALDLMQAADRALRAGDFAEFGRLWTELQSVIRDAAAGGMR